MVSATLKSALYQQETEEVIIVLITITHPDLVAPIRVTSDSVNTISNGNTYVAFPFELQLPSDDPEETPRAKLVIDNIDRTVVNAIRSINSAPAVSIDIILASDLDTVEVSYPNFSLTDVSYDALTVSGTLSMENFLQEPYPAGTFDPSRFRGGF